MGCGNIDVLTLAISKRNADKSVPIGVALPYLGATDPEGGEWFICDGRDTTGTAIELETHYPLLYAFLGDSNVIPDLRECVLVGAGQNDTDTIADHDVYTVGEFKDDQIQNIVGKIEDTDQGTGDQFLSDTSFSLINNSGALFAGNAKTRKSISNNDTTVSSPTSINFDASLSARAGTTTHGKQKGVNYIIKAK